MTEDEKRETILNQKAQIDINVKEKKGFFSFTKLIILGFFGVIAGIIMYIYNIFFGKSNSRKEHEENIKKAHETIDKLNDEIDILVKEDNKKAEEIEKIKEEISKVDETIFSQKEEIKKTEESINETEISDLNSAIDFVNKKYGGNK
jgi:septal ring factor EnvC (AmiA/AmiB activator)